MQKANRLLLLVVSSFSPAAFAQAQAVESSIQRAIDAGTKILFLIAAFMVLYGVVGGGIAISQSDMDGKKKAAAALDGGLLVAMGSKIDTMLFDFGR